MCGQSGQRLAWELLQIILAGRPEPGLWWRALIDCQHLG